MQMQCDRTHNNKTANINVKLVNAMLNLEQSTSKKTMAYLQRNANMKCLNTAFDFFLSPSSLTHI